MGFHDSAWSVTVLLNVWAGDDVHRLEKSLESVFSQTLRNFYLLIVSDGPLPPEIEALIQEFQSRDSLIKMKHERSMPQMGLWYVRNYGISLIQTEYTALHDADDIMHPERLEIQLDSMNDGFIDVLGSSILEFHPETELITGYRAVSDTHSEIKKAMRSGNPMHHSSVMLRTSIINEAIRYRNVHLTEDYDLWIQLMQKNLVFANDSRPLVAFCRDSNLTNRRSGFKFISSEIEIHRQLSAAGLVRSRAHYHVLLARIAYRVGPKFLRNYVHKNLINSNTPPSIKTLEQFLTLRYQL